MVELKAVSALCLQMSHKFRYQFNKIPCAGVEMPGSTCNLWEECENQYIRECRDPLVTHMTTNNPPKNKHTITYIAILSIFRGLCPYTQSFVCIKQSEVNFSCL